MIKKLVLLASACVFFSVGASASITNAESRESVRVNYADLNMNSPEGQERLYHRISRAAKSVCGSTVRSEVSSLKEVMKNRACIKEAISNAVEDAGITLASN